VLIHVFILIPVTVTSVPSREEKDSRKGRKRWERGARKNLFELVSTHAGKNSLGH
jgi:hypothetical protein